MFPNWNNIRNITDPFLRIAMYTATGTESDALQHAFPACFSDTQDDLRVPVSLLRREAELYHIGEGCEGENLAFDREMCWEEAAGRFGIPIAFRWSRSPIEGQTEQIPEEVWRQLEGRELRGGMPVLFHGETFIVINYWDGDEEVGKRIERTNEQFVIVVHSRFIDLTA